MSHPVYENPVTGERSITMVDPRDHPDDVLVADLFVRPGGRVAAPHFHPTIRERFFVLHGQVGFLIGKDERILGPGQGATVEPGTVHDWWQVGEEEAEVIVEVTPGTRFAQMVASLFGLARDGRVSAKGMPDPLQLAVMGREFGDVVVFTKPPPVVQRLTVVPLAALGRLAGKKPMYEEYLESDVRAEPSAEAMAQLTPDRRLRDF